MAIFINLSYFCFLTTIMEIKQALAIKLVLLIASFMESFRTNARNVLWISTGRAEWHVTFSDKS